MIHTKGVIISPNGRSRGYSPGCRKEIHPAHTERVDVTVCLSRSGIDALPACAAVCREKNIAISSDKGICPADGKTPHIDAVGYIGLHPLCGSSGGHG